jgi:hypothetical protein
MIRLIILGGDMLMLTAKQIRKWVRFLHRNYSFRDIKRLLRKEQYVELWRMLRIVRAEFADAGRYAPENGAKLMEKYWGG